MNMPPLVHMDWLSYQGEIKTSEGRPVQVWELACDPKGADVWKSWAREFRQHYCPDELIDVLKEGTEYEHSRAEFLENVIFPDSKKAPGPSIRSGDFGEILVGDFLESKLAYWVPRLRFSTKAVRNESTKGTDVIGFKLVGPNGEPDPKDSLFTVEAKAQLTGKSPSNRLQDAINDSVKDAKRKGESLNALRRRLIEQGRAAEADVIKRFQDKLARPYSETVGAAAILCDSVFDPVHTAANADCSGHPGDTNVLLYVFKSPDFMQLVSDLYRRACDEA